MVAYTDAPRYKAIMSDLINSISVSSIRSRVASVTNRFENTFIAPIQSLVRDNVSESEISLQQELAALRVQISILTERVSTLEKQIPAKKTKKRASTKTAVAAKKVVKKAAKKATKKTSAKKITKKVTKKASGKKAPAKKKRKS